MDERFKSMTFRDVLVQSLQNFATRIYFESQKTVPVKTGRLKGSGSLKYPGGDKVAVIKYDTPYASMINQTQGASSGKQWGGVGDKTMEVSSHKRTYPSGKTVTVRKHTKNVGPRPAGRGNGFLTNAAKNQSKSWAKITAQEFPDKFIVKSLGF
jgi:hypothetical protein